MIIFNSIEEIKKYYNKNTDTYEFIEDGILLDVEFASDLVINGNIKAKNIKAQNISAKNINAKNINADNINAWDIKAYDINADDIDTLNIIAWNINTWNINSLDINAYVINAKNINADNIKAWDIKAWDIRYDAVCFAYQNIACFSIRGRRVNAKHFVLDGVIKIIEKDKELEK